MPAEEKPDESQPEVAEESDAPGVLTSRFSFRFWRRGSREEQERQGGEREERPATGASPDASPLTFWRRGRARTYRQQPMPKQTVGRTLRRIQGLHVPPWMPVMFIIVVVFGILGALFFVRGAAAKPRIGQDHWHSTYQIVICGNRQPNLREWQSGVQTHGDGVIHLHPFVPREEGAGSRLDRWFDEAKRFLGNWEISQDSITLGNGTKYENGDLCDDGRPGKLQVFVNGAPQDRFLRYIPGDGDRLRIVFGPEEVEPVQQEDRTIIAEEQATRTVEVEISGGEADAAFSPPSIEVNTGETVKLAVRNTGSISHGLRVAGPDGEYDTSDDYVIDPEIIPPGEEAVMVVRFDDDGEFEFRDPTIQFAVGTLVAQAEEASEPAEETEAAEEEADVTFDVEMGDNFFQPGELEVEAGQTFRINLINAGEFIHNLHIAGPDDEYETGDDIESDPSFQRAGETGVLVGRIDEPGVYKFRSDFHPTEMVGTITVR